MSSNHSSELPGRPAARIVSGCPATGQRPTAATLLLTVLVMAGASMPAEAQFALPFFGRRNVAKPVPKKTVVVEVRDAASGQPIAGARVASPYLQLDDGQPSDDGRRGLITDAKGEASVGLPEGWLMSSSFALTVEHEGHAAVTVMWNSRDGKVGNLLPAREIVRLEPGRTIGGYVRDADGQPIPQVAITPSSAAANRYTQPTDDSTSGPIPGTHRPYITPRHSMPVTTDARGFWTYPDLPRELVDVLLHVATPDGTRLNFCPPELVSATQGGRAYDPAGLGATNVVLTIPRGHTVRGTVVDLEGKPIAGATVLEGIGTSVNPQRPPTNTGPDGRFVFSNRQPRQIALSAYAPGFALGSVVYQIQSNSPDARLVLSPAQPMRVRMVDTNGRPVNGANWSLRPRAGSAHVQFWNDITDEEGRIAWSNAPLGRMSYQITSRRGDSQIVNLIADGQEHTITNLALRPNSPIRISGRVTDASGAPVPNFRVFKIDQNRSDPQPWVLGTNGMFEAVLTQWYPGLQYRVMVRANGFVTWRSDSLDPTEAGTPLTAVLAPEVALIGTILQPDGRPAPSAQISLPTSEWSSIYMGESGKINNNSSYTVVKASAAGKYQLPALERDRLIGVVHSSGLALLMPDDFRRTNVVQLQPWARLEGTVPREVAATLHGNLGLIFKPGTLPNSDQFQASLWSRVEPSGRFTFTNVPPGDYRLVRQNRNRPGPTIYSHAMPLTLRGGETTKVTYSMNGRSVLGLVEADGPAEVDWLNDNHVLVEKSPGINQAPPSYEDYVVNEDYQAAHRIFYNRQENAGAGGRQFLLGFDRDGGFRADDIPPGVYDLRLRLTEPPTNRRSGYYSGNARELGALTREVRIPAPTAGDSNPFNLGSFVVPVKGTARALTAAPALQATSIDGQPFDLANLRGRPVVALFWSSWAPESTNQLARLVALQPQFATQSVAMVTVNIDDPADVVRSRVGKGGKDASHLHLVGPQRISQTESFGIETLPQVFLIDGEGRIVSRSSNTRSLAANLRRLSAPPRANP